jgi:hypothetical protein
VADEIKVYDDYGKFPSIPNVFKRDRETHQVIPGEWTSDEIRYLQDNWWIFTEKVDGMNVRVIFDHGKLSYRGRTDRAQMPEDLIENLDRLFSPYRNDFGSACFYGEGYGPGIQKGGKYREDKGFILFDIKIGHTYLNYNMVTNIGIAMGVDVTPIIFSGKLEAGTSIVKKGLRSKVAESNDQFGDFFAEGLVAMPGYPLYYKNCSRIITKIKHRDFYVEDK